VPSVGVVLGAGGVVGAAYHAGVLTALAEAGFDARDAGIIVGTSAGSGVGATLRAGFPPVDLAPRALGQPISDEAVALVGHTGPPPVIELRPRTPSRPPLPSSPRLLLHTGRHPAKALTGMLPAGTISGDPIGERIAALYGGRQWPARPLWVCAVDLDHGDRVVFGRDAVTAPVGIAVQASSAIPGVFSPVTHAGRRFVDGGVHSPTNADLLAGAGFDLVVVVSPMSVVSSDRGAGRDRWQLGLRLLHARQLAKEIGRLRAAGVETLTFQPTAADLAAMGRNAMDPERRRPTVESALATARERLADPALAGRLDALRAASP
jgi:NTE family protein